MGTYITTPQVSAEKATVAFETSINNNNADLTEATITTTIFKGDSEVTSVSQEISIPANAEKTIKQETNVNKPVLWNVESPELYTAITEVKVGNNYC